jgi:hypothetical protein
MGRMAPDWGALRTWIGTHGVELRLCVRSTTAALLTLAAAQVLNPYRAVGGAHRCHPDANQCRQVAQSDDGLFDQHPWRRQHTRPFLDSLAFEPADDPAQGG